MRIRLVVSLCLVAVALCLWWLWPRGDTSLETGTAETHPAKRGRLRDVDQIVQLLDQCPDWWRLDKNDAHGRQQVMRIMARIGRYELPEIEAAVAIYYSKVESSNDIEKLFKAHSCLYVLNKYLFDVPEWLPGSDFPGGWMGKPREKDGQWNALWPLSRGKKGSLRLTGEAVGFAGTMLDPVEAFRAYKEAFPRRDLSDANAGEPVRRK